MEVLYEKRLRKKPLPKPEEENKTQVDRVDALPVKTLEGELYYRTCISYLSSLSHIMSSYICIFTLLLLAAKTSDAPEDGGNEEAMEEDRVDNGVLKLTKAERRAKLKKTKKVAKKQEDVTKAEEVKPTPQAAVLVFFCDFTLLLLYSTVA